MVRQGGYSKHSGMHKLQLPLYVCRENIASDVATPSDGIAAYFVHGGHKPGEPVFDETLGLTVEAMPADVTIKSLWSVL